MSNSILATKFLILLLTFSSPLMAKDYIKFSDRFVKHYINTVAKPNRLILTGEGGAMMHDIEQISLKFESFNAASVDEARILFVEMMEEFLCRINRNETLRPYLHNYPFETENFRLTISYSDARGNITSDGHVALVFIGKNNDLLFEAYDAEQRKFYSLHREPYEDAKRLVENDRTGSCLDVKR